MNHTMTRISENGKMKLKELAKNDNRSMANYLETMLTKLYVELKEMEMKENKQNNKL
jgi:hypothetical protein